MKITAIVPVYNADKYLKKCLDSLIGNVDEIIVVNDGSTDNTLEILKKYKDVRVFNNENHGVSFSRNYGIKEANGDYIMFVDADDYLKENFKETITKYSFQDEDVVYFNEKIDVNINEQRILEHIIGYETPCIAGPYCKLYNKKFLQKNNIKFKEGLINGEDMLFNVECALKMKKYKIINSSIYMYRVSLASATKRFDSKIFKSDAIFQTHIENLLDNCSISNSKELIDFCKINAIITITDRCSYVDKYYDFKKNIGLLNNELYLITLNIVKTKISLKKRILLFIEEKKRYRILYVLLKLNHKKYSSGQEFFLEI